MRFRTQYDRERKITRSGKSVINKYGARYDDNGHLVVEVVGKRDIYPEIQAHAQSCDINYIVSRFANGDVSALSKIQGTYGDFTTFPKTYAELLNNVNRGAELFDTLPVDVRAKFNHSLGEFMQSAGSSEWMQKLGISVPDQSAPEIVVPDAVKEVAPIE